MSEYRACRRTWRGFQQGKKSAESFRGGCESEGDDTVRDEKFSRECYQQDDCQIRQCDGYMMEGYQLYDARADLKNVKGGYWISDNWYLDWPTMMVPNKRAVDVQDYN